MLHMADNENGKRAEVEGQEKSRRKEKKRRSKDKRWKRILERNTTDTKRKCDETGKRRVKRTNVIGSVIICMSHRGKGWEAVFRKTNLHSQNMSFRGTC